MSPGQPEMVTISPILQMKKQAQRSHTAGEWQNQEPKPDDPKAQNQLVILKQGIRGSLSGFLAKDSHSVLLRSKNFTGRDHTLGI